MPTEITAQDVAAQMGIDLPDPQTYDRRHLDQITAAVNVMVPGTVPRVRELLPAEHWPADVLSAALIMAARLFARRNSPTGVAAYTDAGPSYVARWDPDLERLLLIGSWARPQVG
jgi:hypothetical protein